MKKTSYKQYFNNFKKRWMQNNKNTFDQVKFFKEHIESKFGIYILEQIFKINDDFGFGDDLSRAHDLFALSNYTGISHSKASGFLMDDKKGDGGIDSFFYDEFNKELILFQTKFEKIKDSYLSKMITSYEEYIRPKKRAIGNFEGLNKIIDFMEDKSYNKVSFVCINPGNRRIEELRNSYSCKFIGWENLLKDAVNNINKRVNITISEFSRNALTNIKLNELGMAQHFKVSIKELISKLCEYNDVFQDSLFNANIRGDVTKDKKDFEKGFKETLANYPERFELYNNGITIVCKKIENDITNRTVLVDPQIINGQQTTRNLIRISTEFNISDKAYIYIKAIETEDDNLIIDIAKYSNAQSKVKEADLISTTAEFKKLNELCTTNNFFLSAKEGISKMQEVYKKLNMKYLQMDKIVKMHVAFFNPAAMGKAKSAKGSVIREYINDKKLSTMKIDFIKKVHETSKIYANIIKVGKEMYLKKYDNFEAKKMNKIWGVAELAIYRMIFLGMDETQIINKICDYQESFVDDSIMNAFKSSKAYVELEII